jgi:hypothetical protein
LGIESDGRILGRLTYATSTSNPTIDSDAGVGVAEQETLVLADHREAYSFDFLKFRQSYRVGDFD